MVKRHSDTLSIRLGRIRLALVTDVELKKDVMFKFDRARCEGPLFHFGDRLFLGSNVDFNVTKSIRVDVD